MITASWVGYAYGEEQVNPDGSPIYDGQDVYQFPNGKRVDAYWLMKQLNVRGGLGDKPQVPNEIAQKFDLV